MRDRHAWADFRRRLLAWYRQAGRDLPWRRTSDPYAVWVSEVMLQQTTVATVIPKHEAFLRAFPNVAALAAAEEQAVLRAWEGLGYYRRARHLHAAARQVVAQHDGKIPLAAAELQQLPGLGCYAANAVACFAGGAREPILEANTVRAWSRQLAISDPPTRQLARKKLWAAAAAVLPPRGSAAALNHALMDLGAMVCTPVAPHCGECPVAVHCQALALGRPEDFPAPVARPPVEQRREVAVMLWRAGKVLVRQRPERGRWSAMWEFPVAELAPAVRPEAAAAAMAPAAKLAPRLVVKYTVMRWRVELHAFEGQHPMGANAPPGVWLRPGDLQPLPFATPQRRLASAAADGPREPPFR